MRTALQKAVIFDVGRVLVTWEPLRMLEGLAEVSRAGVDELRAILRAIDEPLGTGVLDAQAFHQHLMHEAGATADWDAFFQGACRGLSRIEEGLDLARSLAARPDVRTAVISNTNHLHVLWLRAHLPELAAMDAVVFSPEAGMQKPDPAIFRLALARLEVRSADAFFVDDIADYVAGAQALGMGGVAHTDWSISRPAVEAWLAG